MFRCTLTSGIGAAIVLSVLAGCGTTGSERAAAAATSMQSTRDELTTASASLEKTIKALTTMIEQPAADLKEQYEAFGAALAELRSDARAVQKAADRMKARGDAYFAGWGEEITQITSPELRGKSTERLQLLDERYQAVTASYESAKAAFQPLLASLSDVRAVLGLDLTSEGLKLAAAPAEKAHKDAESVRKEIAAASAAIDDLATTLGGGKGGAGPN